MGQRANLLIVTPAGYELYYTHWRANTLPFDLFWGPAHAAAFIRAQRAATDDDGWLDTVWAEGGVVLDPLRQTLLFYGGEDVKFDVPLRRVYFELMQTTWPGWSLRWAHEGIVEMAEYVGRERGSVVGDWKPDKFITDLGQKGEFVQSIATVREHGITFYPLLGWAEHYMVAGPRLLESHRERLTSERYVVDVREMIGGLHIDVPRQRVDYWLPYKHYQPEDIQAAWPDWNVVWHHDRFEVHAELAKECAEFKIPDRQLLLDQLAEALLHVSSPIDAAETARLLEEKRVGRIEINPFALRDDVLNLPGDDRREILNRALDQICRNVS